VAQTRLQKVLAQAGVASRRKCEEIILDGRVRVNGKIEKTMGTKVDPRKDRIEVNGRIIAAEQPLTVLMNKPRGVVCTASDPEGRETVVDLVKNEDARLFPVGRLDFATSGALLLTNDGDLSYALTHPKHEVEKTYLLKVRGHVDEVDLQKWRDGVDIGDAVTRPATVFKAEEEPNFTWVEITIKEGRNRQIRRMGEAIGVKINKLKRVSFAGLTIEGIKIGQYRRLTQKELARIKRDHINPTQKEKTDAPPERDDDTLKIREKRPRAKPQSARRPQTARPPRGKNQDTKRAQTRRPPSSKSQSGKTARATRQIRKKK
jgi:23S rRNA pseudouridine2605 synthase